MSNPTPEELADYRERFIWNEGDITIITLPTGHDEDVDDGDEEFDDATAPPRATGQEPTTSP